MGNVLTSLVMKRKLNETVANNLGRKEEDDPWYETVPATDMGRKKHKKKKKAMPPGISDRDRRILKRVKRRAWYLDMSLCWCCGTRVGWSAIIGFMPFIGDAIDAMLALSLVNTAQEADLPASVTMQMYANVAVDFGIGLIPIIGDIGDIMYKCNIRNTILLEKHLRKRGIENTTAGESISTGGVDATYLSQPAPPKSAWQTWRKAPPPDREAFPNSNMASAQVPGQESGIVNT